MYPLDEAMLNNINFHWNTKASGDFAMMADLNPGERLNGANGPSCVISVSHLYNGTGPTVPTDAQRIQKSPTATITARPDRTCSTPMVMSALVGENNIFTTNTQFVQPLASGADSVLEPNDGALTLGRGIGIQ